MALWTGAKTPIVTGAPPRVSLLPAGQRAALRHEKTMPKLLLMVVASAAIAALISGAGFAVALTQQQQLNVVEAESNDLLTQFAEFGEVQQLMNQSTTLTALRQQLTGDEVLFVDSRDEIVLGLPAGSSLIGFAAKTLADDGAEPAGESASVCGPGAAELTLTIRSPRFTEAADLIDSLGAVTGFQCAIVTSSLAEPGEVVSEGGEGGTDGTVTTIIAVTLGPESISGRFAPEETN